MAIFIDVGDGTLISPPPASPPPQVPPAAPPPPPPPDVIARVIASGQDVFTTPAPAAPPPQVAQAPPPDVIQRVIASGQDVFTPLPAPPPDVIQRVISSGQDVFVDIAASDAAQAADDANANEPDLSDLPEWELIDPFGIEEFAVTNPPLKGTAALTAMVKAGEKYGVDPLAIVADSFGEGAGGTVGDGGYAYGPFQDHLTEFAGRPFYGKGKDNPVVNAWAWTNNGIEYSVRQMVTSVPSAKGLTGHAAIYAMVYGYERPGDKPKAYSDRSGYYDHLVSLGSGWASYAAGRLAGPVAGGAVDTAPSGGGTVAAKKPAGLQSNWRELVDVFKLTVPRERAKVRGIADSLTEVFK